IFFFFQAEDGIRDFHVTGVQTCALPIWALELLAVSPASGWHGGCRYLGAAPLFAPPNDREQGETRQVGLPALMDQEKGCHGADNAPHPRQWTTEVVYGRYR